MPWQLNLTDFEKPCVWRREQHSLFYRVDLIFRIFCFLRRLITVAATSRFRFKIQNA